MIRSTNDREEVFPDPVIQVNHQKYQLSNILKQRKIPYLPIETLVVMTNTQALMKVTSKATLYKDKVIRSANLLISIESLNNKHNKEILSKKDLKKLSTFLLRNDFEYSPNYLKTFQISELDLICGVICPNCSFIPLKRRRGMWICSKCSFSSKSAHIEALRDYCYLIGNEITNNKARAFLKIQSESTTNKILTSLNIPMSGSFKGRKYELSKLK